MCAVFDKVTDLSCKLTQWAVNSGIKLAQGRRISGVTRYHGKSTEDEEEDNGQTFVIATGGGPGFMEAANMGAAMVEGAKSIGVSAHSFDCIVRAPLLSLSLYEYYCVI